MEEGEKVLSKGMDTMDPEAFPLLVALKTRMEENPPPPVMDLLEDAEYRVTAILRQCPGAYRETVENFLLQGKEVLLGEDEQAIGNEIQTLEELFNKLPDLKNAQSDIQRPLPSRLYMNALENSKRLFQDLLQLLNKVKNFQSAVWGISSDWQERFLVRITCIFAWEFPLELSFQRLINCLIFCTGNPGDGRSWGAFAL
mgnify:CR=1 FL=1